MPLAHPSVGEVMNAPIRVLVRRLVHLVPRSQSHSVLSSMAIRRASSRSEIRCGRLPRDPQERQEGNASDSTRGLLPTSRTSADLEGESRVEAQPWPRRSRIAAAREVPSTGERGAGVRHRTPGVGNPSSAARGATAGLQRANGRTRGFRAQFGLHRNFAGPLEEAGTHRAQRRGRGGIHERPCRRRDCHRCGV